MVASASISDIEDNAVFIELVGKKAKDPEWQTGKTAKRRADIKGNAGLLLGHAGLVDVDCDTLEARAVAGRFLPRNTLSIGRGGTVSHLLYEGVAENRTIKLPSARTDTTVIEIRNAGRQVMWAGSTHPDTGETIEVLNDVAPAPYPGDRPVLLTATAAIIARHLPEDGRHDLALPLAGTLLRRGLNEVETLEVMEAAWDYKAAPREAFRDLQDIVESTKEKLENDEPNTGGKTLKDDYPNLYKDLAKTWGWKKEKRKAATDDLVSVALDMADELFTDQYGQPYALVSGRSLPVEGMADGLRTRYFRAENKSASNEAIRNALATVAALAKTEGPERELHTRWARVGASIYYQTAPGKVWRIGPSGWVQDSKPPVRFRDVPLLKDLPDPEKGGQLEDLCRYAQLEGANLRLYVAWLASVPYHDIPRPVLAMIGGKGTGKTTRSLLAKRLLDEDSTDFVSPNADILRKATHRGIVAADNQTGLERGVVNTFCGLVTGTGDSSRKLYTDNDEYGFKVKSPAILNGIDLASNQPDLLDRMLIIETPPVSPDSRFTEREFWGAFGRDRGKLLGVVFDLISGSLRHHQPLDNRPRLADWAEIASAVYEYASWGREQFAQDWVQTEDKQNTNALEGSVVGSTLIDYLAYKDETFEGTAQELLDDLLRFDYGLKFNKFFPQTPNRLSKEINKVADALKANGVLVSRTTIGKGKNARRGIKLEGLPIQPESVDGLPIESGVSTDRGFGIGIGNTPHHASRSADSADRFSFLEEEEESYSGEGDEYKEESPQDLSTDRQTSTDRPIYADSADDLSTDLSTDLPADRAIDVGDLWERDPESWGLYEILLNLYDCDIGMQQIYSGYGFYHDTLSDNKLWSELVGGGFVDASTTVDEVSDARARVRERLR